MRTDLFDQYATLDPAETPEALPDWTSTAPVLLAEIDERTHPMQTQHRPNTSTEPKRRWTGVLVAAVAFALVLIVGMSVLLLNRGGGPLDVITPVTTSTATAQTTVVPTTVAPATMDVVPEAWKPAPLRNHCQGCTAACHLSTRHRSERTWPCGSGAAIPGVAGDLAAVFDTHAGQIVYVDGVGETWTFDVCTNSWHEMNPTGRPTHMSGYSAMVYDVDSDVTVAFAGGRTWAYDANNNTWTEGRTKRPGWDVSLGAVYDPVSGLIITSNPSLTEAADPDRWDLWAYDVDTDEWTLLGPVPIDRTTPCCTQIDLLGYSPKLDRLILVTPSEYSTILIDPRSGETTLVATDSPIVDLIWPSDVYGPANDTVYVYEGIYRSAGGPYAFAACGFDAGTLTWPCVVSPSDPPDRYRWFTTIVEDPINERLLFINSSVVVFSSEGGDDTDDVWAIDLDTGEWTQLLAPSSP